MMCGTGGSPSTIVSNRWLLANGSAGCWSMAAPRLLDQHNADARPFIWTPAADILEKSPEDDER
jgi:hypothetical protein